MFLREMSFGSSAPKPTARISATEFARFPVLFRRRRTLRWIISAWQLRALPPRATAQWLSRYEGPFVRCASWAGVLFRRRYDSAISAASNALHKGSKGSQPTEIRTKPAATLSPQRARRSADVCIPPKLVDGMTKRQFLINSSACSASSSVSPITLPNVVICLRAT